MAMATENLRFAGGVITTRTTPTLPWIPRCELRIGRVSESNRCYTVRKGLWERTTLGRRYFFRQLCNLACRYLIGW